MGAVCWQIKNKDVVCLPLGYFGGKSFAMMDFCIVNHDNATTFIAFVRNKIIDGANNKRAIDLFQGGVGMKLIVAAH